MLTLTELLICVFGAAGLADLLLKDKRLERVRYWIETREVPLLKDLVACRFCLTHWTAAAALWAGVAYKTGGDVWFVIYAVLCWFAVIAAANRLPGGE
jgi:hypothetical protein